MGMLKPIEDQTIVITGATSGIGLATVHMAAQRGARLVLAARNEQALWTLAEEIRSRGGQATYAAADVGVKDQVDDVAQAAITAFGGFDTWINNAAVSIFGRLDEVPIEDMRRLFETNFWGVVHGSLAAVRHFKQRGGPGKIINLGSILGERAIPIQGIYSASKHAVAGFTEALRIEMDAERLPVSITLIKPSAIDTPYKDHAKNFMDRAPINPPPVYEAEVVGRAILHACEHRTRDLMVGGFGRLIDLASGLAPRATDHIMARLMPWLQRSSEPPKPREQHTLHRPGEGLSEHAHYPVTRKSSIYTRAMMQPVASALVAGAGLSLSLAAFAALQARRSTASSRRARRHPG
jgi:short-subunit dehydrogenase